VWHRAKDRADAGQASKRSLDRGLTSARALQPLPKASIVRGSLELKLCVSVYDLYELRHNADAYRPQLSEIYGSFSEGFDTTDLVRAKARLKNG